jgi:hypothetical protein
MGLIAEISQFGFILSIIYIFFVIVNLFIKIYGRFKLGNDTKFVMSNWEKSLLLISISYILSFLI